MWILAVQELKIGRRVAETITPIHNSFWSHFCAAPCESFGGGYHCYQT